MPGPLPPPLPLPPPPLLPPPLPPLPFVGVIPGSDLHAIAATARSAPNIKGQRGLGKTGAKLSDFPARHHHVVVSFSACSMRGSATGGFASRRRILHGEAAEGQQRGLALRGVAGRRGAQARKAIPEP